MNAGRELDALVAEKVMGWELQNFAWKVGEGKIRPVTTWSPSTNISDAWQVVEKLRDKNLNFSIETLEDEYYAGVRATGFHIYIADKYAETAPLAICIAALKAVEVNVDETWSQAYKSPEDAD